MTDRTGENVSRRLPVRSGLAFRREGTSCEMEKEGKLEEKSRKTYLEGLQKYKERGIPILIDGREAGPKEWDRIFQVCEPEESFYMADFILDDEEEGEGHSRKLKEIRFDKVYYR